MCGFVIDFWPYFPPAASRAAHGASGRVTRPDCWVTLSWSRQADAEEAPIWRR